MANQSNSSVAIIVSDASIKNNVATSIAHIHVFDKPLMKTIHYAIHVTSTEVELFAIRCGINQSLNINNLSKIVVITNSIHVVKKIFDPSVHPYQLLWDAWDMNNFYFLFLLFSDFIGILFSFFFSL